MLPLDTEEQVEKAKKAIKTVEEPIKKLITEKGIDGKLRLEFEGL